MSKKLTKEEFIEKARLVHGDRYDYSKFIYINCMTKGIIICKEHGEFLQTPNSHISKKQNCFKCGKIKQGNSYIKYNIEEKGNLIDNNPKLCKEWDYDKNYPLRPEQFTEHSGKKVHWSN